jgi:dihydrofolate reductase
MKTILVFVSTLDGKVTRWGDPFVRRWSSKEDQDYFKKTWNEFRAIIVGSATWDAEPIATSPGRLLVIMTRNPERYRGQEIPGQLEFSDAPPARLHERFRKEGVEQLLVAGGPHIAASFLKEYLIDELWLTLEPRIFGSGGNFVSDEQLDIGLQLLSCRRVNDRGTMITKYRIIRANDHE